MSLHRGSYLHDNIIINSDKQKSAQGSVFYVKQGNDSTKELVLKIYKNNDMKSYFKEIAVFRKLEEKQKQLAAEREEMPGFPKILSTKESSSSAELLMEALGPNIRKLLKQCPTGLFSKTTTYIITI